MSSSHVPHEQRDSGGPGAASMSPAVLRRGPTPSLALTRNMGRFPARKSKIERCSNRVRGVSEEHRAMKSRTLRES